MAGQVAASRAAADRPGIGDLGEARILVTNDDGITAPGLAALLRIARGLSRDIWVVAPETQQSGVSHGLTLRRPLRIRQLAPKRFAVDGTPTDCVLLGVHEILSDRAPDLVLSGVNWGANLGEDIGYSGTVAAASEATLFGIRAIAMSLDIVGERPRWATAEAIAPGLIQRVAAAPWPADTLVNVNFPDRIAEDVAGIRVVAAGRRKQGVGIDRRTDPAGQPYFWFKDWTGDPREAGENDLAAIATGAVTVTPVTIDRTSHAGLVALRAALDTP